MGEYVKYKGSEIKIGTCEDLYYVSYPKYQQAFKSGLLRKSQGSINPSEYMLPDSGFRFRFPFPDEDNLPLGEILEQEGFRRGLPVTIEPDYQVEITQQKLVHRESDGKLCLALICKDASDGNSYRVEDDADVKKVLTGIVRNHIVNESDPERRNFYRQIGARIMKGYRMKPPAQRLRIQAGKHRKTRVKQNRGTKRGL